MTDAQAPVAVRALQPATKRRLILICLYHVTELLLSLLASIIRGCVVSLQTHTSHFCLWEFYVVLYIFLI